MKHLRKFNENENKSFKNTDDDIKMFFGDYIDNDSDCLTIENALVYNGDVVSETSYMKDPSKYRRCKVVTLTVGEGGGVELQGMGGKCFTSFDVLKRVVNDIERFYAVLEEEVNYTIQNDYSGLEITFVTLGESMSESDTKKDKIDKYIQELKDIYTKYFKKRSKINGNWFEVRTTKAEAKESMYRDYSFNLRTFMGKINDGTINQNNADSDSKKALVDLRNRMENGGITMSIGGGDHQMVIKLVNI